MKTCAYCGRQNEDALFFCGECGTAFPVEPITVPIGSPIPPRAEAHGTLNASKAVAILAVYLAVQTLVGVMIGMIAVALSRISGSGSVWQTSQTIRSIMPIAVVEIVILGGISTVLMLILLAPNHIKDTSPTGAAWVVGKRDAIISGFLLGLFLAGGFCLMSLFVHPQYPSHVGPLTQMSMTRGWPQILWSVVAVFLAPPSEEMLFRGAAYGGFRKSCGALWAGVLVTVIFVGLHFAEFIYYPFAIFSITGLALLTLWARLRWGAVGPAIAVHVAYNLVVTIATLYSTNVLSSTFR